MRKIDVLLLTALFCWSCGSSDFSDNQKCAAVTSFFGWEIVQADDEELVVSTVDDENSLNLNWPTEEEERRALELFSQMPWVKLDGVSPWMQPVHPEKVAKSFEDKVMVQELFDDRKARNAVSSCTGLQKVIKLHAISHGDQDVAKVIANKDAQTNQYPKAVAAYYMPVLSKDRQSAVLFASRAWAPMASVGMILKIERQQSGEWVPTGAQVLTVS